MSWLRIDDAMVDHPKVAILSDSAFRWWFRALAYAARYLTDGALPEAFLRTVPAKTRRELEAGLWDVDEHGVTIHDYTDYQQTRAMVHERRQETKARVQQWRVTRRKRARNTVTGSPVTVDVTPPTSTSTSTTHPPVSKNDTGGGAPLTSRGEALRWGQRHGRHEPGGFCEQGICLDPDQVAEFAARLPGDDLEDRRRQVLAWAATVREAWRDQVKPDGSPFEFWRHRWTEQFGGSRPASATLKAVRAERALNDALEGF